MSDSSRISRCLEIPFCGVLTLTRAFGADCMMCVIKGAKSVRLTMVDREPTLRKLSKIFGGTVEFPYWQVFTGQPANVLAKSAFVLSETPLSEGWRVQSYTHPDEATIAQSQALNSKAGVAPAPAYYLRGHVIPSTLCCIYDTSGCMAACASGTMRYHPYSTLAGWMFAGGVSVHPDHRRKGLGAYVNAALLRDSHATHNWTAALEQAKNDNLPSVGMIRKCGLAPFNDKVTIVVNLTGGHITR